MQWNLFLLILMVNELDTGLELLQTPSYRPGQWTRSDQENGALMTVTKPFFCYEDKVILINQRKTWEEALYYCRQKNSDLVSITNRHQQRREPRRLTPDMSGWDCATPALWTYGSGSVTSLSAMRSGLNRERMRSVAWLLACREKDSMSGSERWKMSSIILFVLPSKF